jgi:uncharacterized protein YjbJ (UPF0337 family)
MSLVHEDRQQAVFNWKVRAMDWDRIEGDWQTHKASFKRRWRKLSNVDVVTGQRERLAVSIQEKYGISNDEAQKQLNDWQGRQTDSECSREVLPVEPQNS